MDTAPPPTAPDRTVRMLNALAELSELALELARDAHRRAKSAQSPETRAAFDRSARTVSRLFALETWIAHGHAARQATRHAEQASRSAEANNAQRSPQKPRLRPKPGPATPDAASAPHQQRFRLDDYLDRNLLNATATTPLIEIVEKLCHALGIAPHRIPDRAAFAEPPAAVAKFRPPAAEPPPPPYPGATQPRPGPTQLPGTLIV